MSTTLALRTPAPPPRPSAALTKPLITLVGAATLGGVLFAGYWYGEARLAFYVTVGLVVVYGLWGCVFDAFRQWREGRWLRRANEALATGNKEILRAHGPLVIGCMAVVVHQGEANADRIDAQSVLRALEDVLSRGARRASAAGVVAASLGVWMTMVGLFLGLTSITQTSEAGAVIIDAGGLGDLATCFVSSAVGIASNILLGMLSGTVLENAHRIALATETVIETRIRPFVEGGAS